MRGDMNESRFKGDPRIPLTQRPIHQSRKKSKDKSLELKVAHQKIAKLLKEREYIAEILEVSPEENLVVEVEVLIKAYNLLADCEEEKNE